MWENYTCLPNKGLQLNSYQCKMKPKGGRASIPPTQLVHLCKSSWEHKCKGCDIGTHKWGWLHSCNGITLISVVVIVQQKRAQCQISKLSFMPPGPLFKPPLTKRTTWLLATFKNKLITWYRNEKITTTG